jgi:hypothetical protein
VGGYLYSKNSEGIKPVRDTIRMACEAGKVRCESHLHNHCRSDSALVGGVNYRAGQIPEAELAELRSTWGRKIALEIWMGYNGRSNP